MKLSQWAKTQGISYRTAWNWFKSNKLPVKSYQSLTGTILVQEQENVNQKNEEILVDIYGRQELEHQIKQCEEFCIKNGWKVNEIYKENLSEYYDDIKSVKIVVLYNP